MGSVAREALPAGPEIYIGLVGAVGTDLDAVTQAVEKALAHVDYQPTLVKLSDLLDEVEPSSIDDWPNLSDASFDGRISTRMTAGDLFESAWTAAKPLRCSRCSASVVCGASSKKPA